MDCFSKVSSNVVGEHIGFNCYTIGQSSNLAGLTKKFYVCEKDNENNTITLCEGKSVFNIKF